MEGTTIPNAFFVNLAIFAVGITAITVVAIYYDETPWRNLMYVFLALTIAAMVAVSFFTTRKKPT